MNEEWRWNNENSTASMDEVNINQNVVHTDTQSDLNENMNDSEEKKSVAQNTVINQEPITDSEATINQEQAVQQEDTVNQETAPEQTYHWVNPEYQRRQNMASSLNETNTYTNTNYKDTVESEQRKTQGYAGGSYHGDWKNRRVVNSEGHKEEQNIYNSYPLNQSSSETPKKKQKKNRRFKKLMHTVASAIVFGLVAGLVMFGVNKVANHFWGDDQEDPKQVPIVQMQQGDSAKEDSGEGNTNGGNSSAESGYTVKEVAANCMPSVVSITSASVTMVQNYFGGVQEYPNESSGSGIIVGQNDTELLIATNNHVIAGAETVTVAFFDDSVYAAQKKGSASNADLAVLAVRLSDMSDETLEAIRIIKIGNSDNLEIGEQVVAIGNALGYGQSVTSGWVSAVNRSVEDEDGNVADSLIQTDAAINPGNSGGALLNMRGELIGINSAKVAQTKVEGMGYAISIAKAEPILNELMNIKTRYKVDESKACYLGITCYNVEAIATQMYGIPAGAYIESVAEGGPVDKAGMRKGDVIVKFDKQAVTGSTNLIELLEYYEAGETVEIIVARAEQGEYKEITLTVKLGHKSEMKSE